MKKKYLFLFLFIIAILYGCRHEQVCCGKVTEKYLLHKNNGGTHNLVFYCDSLHRYINISVTPDTYVNTQIGERVCFTLYDNQIGK